MAKIMSPLELSTLRKELIQKSRSKAISITICSGTGCIACGSKDLALAFTKELEKYNLLGRVAVRETGCHGFCERGPVVVIAPSNICYLKVGEPDIAEIVAKTILENQIIERLVYEDPNTHQRLANLNDIPFYKHQKRVLLEQNVLVNPTSISDYIAVDGYSALVKALLYSKPDDIVKTIKDAHLRGRGGGGFPTGAKWETTRNAPGDVKYVIVNADEGDPGAYMDRSLMEGNPHGVLEGLIIGGYAIGAQEGYIYIRQEYPLALKNTEKAIQQARDYGFLGKNILGTDFSFDVIIHRGAGAFVSGESSALMNAIEGHVGEPRPKYIHTSVKGLWERPSCLNNVETWANVPHIVNKGVEWFRSMGTAHSKGTKIFSLVGKVNNTGLVEVPMGISLKKIIYDIGGGIPKAKKFKAVQTGGPSGGVLPEKLLNLPVDFDALTEAGSMMGSGGLIVMDEDTCIVDTARYYINFLAHESCGKCLPCREGLRQMLKILTNITEGNGNEGDIELLEELCELLTKTSLCALGQSAANPVTSALKYFRAEFEAHIQDKRCPAGVCKNLFCYEVDTKKCKACGACFKTCPADAIKWEKKQVAEIIQEKCIKCGACIAACPAKFNAIKKIHVKPVLQEC